MKINHKLAIFLAAACHQTTVQLTNYGNFVIPQGFQIVKSIFATSEEAPPEFFGFIIESEKTIIIAFRGTLSPYDAENVLDIYQTEFPFVPEAGKTHQGFTEIYSSVRESVIEGLEELSPKKKLIITGHSLGGVLATLSALDIAVNTNFKQPIVYTFASPRVGDPKFAQNYDKIVKNNLRIVNVHDVVPLELQRRYEPPFVKNGLFYRHVKGKHPISFQNYNLLKNHSLANYLLAIKKLNPEYAEKIINDNEGFLPTSTEDEENNFFPNFSPRPFE